MKKTLLAVLACLLACGTARAQFQEAEPGGPRLGEPATSKWQAGLVVRAGNGACRGIVGTAAVPIDWPEQQVIVADEEITPTAKMSYRAVGATAKLMVVSIPFLQPREEGRALVTLEVRRSSQLPPEDTSGYTVAPERKLERSVRPYLGPSPQIENRHPRIQKLARELASPGHKGWEHVAAIFDWVRNNVKKTTGKNVGAAAAITTGQGTHEDIASAFIALCRASGIPARTVWVPAYCYAEFYLFDAEGKGHWFPADVAGNAELGASTETRPILFKGDNYRPPHDDNDIQRFPAEYLTGKGGSPDYDFVRKLVD